MPKARYFVVALMPLGFMLSVQADPPRAREAGGQPEKQRGYQKHETGRQRAKKAARRDHFVDDDRVVIRNFYTQNPSSLPPGLARRGGNLPPGLSRGQVVTPEYHAHLLPLPHELEIRLPPPPHEVIRRTLGHDIVLINKQTNKVLDVLHDALPH